MQFLDMDEMNARKGETIMESVVNIARILRIPIFVEGAETEHQIALLTSMGCRYVQGYYYYKPMPLDEFEHLLETKDVDYNDLQMKAVEQVHIRELMDENIYSKTMLNNILGPVAFCDYHDDLVEVNSVNEQFYQLMQMQAEDFEQFNLNMKHYVRHQKLFKALFQQAYENKVAGVQCNFKGQRLNGEEVHLHVRVFFLRETDGHQIYYVGFTDTTAPELELF